MGDKTIKIDAGQFRQLDTSIDANRGAINKLAEAVGPVEDKESISHKLAAIAELIRHKEISVVIDQQALIGAIEAGFAAVAAEIAKLNTPEPPPAPRLKGRLTLILKNDQPDFGYDFDVSGITDAEGEEITDEAVLAQVVKEVSSNNEGVLSATPADAGGAGTCHVGTSGSADLSGKAWLNQADKDAGKDPAFLAVEPFTITTGDPAAITEGAFKFDIDSGGTPAVEG